MVFNLEVPVQNKLPIINLVNLIYIFPNLKIIDNLKERSSSIPTNLFFKYVFHTVVNQEIKEKWL